MWDELTEQYLQYLEQYWIVGVLIKIALICAGAFVLYRIIRVATQNFRRLSIVENDPLERARSEARLATLGSILDNLAWFVIVAVVVVMSLAEIGYDVAPLIAGAGIAGLAIGFGAQSLVKDFFAGFFILFENQYAIGDVVTLAGLTGVVERMTLRVTVLRSYDGNLHIVPNGRIDTVTVIAKEWARILLDVTIPYGEDLQKALTIIEQTSRAYGQENPDKVLADEEPVIGVQDLGPRGAIVRLVMKMAQGKQHEAARDLRRRLIQALSDEGIQLIQPFVNPREV